jgi:hypothetical protein
LIGALLRRYAAATLFQGRNCVRKSDLAPAFTQQIHKPRPLTNGSLNTHGGIARDMRRVLD